MYNDYKHNNNITHFFILVCLLLGINACSLPEKVMQDPRIKSFDNATYLPEGKTYLNQNKINIGGEVNNDEKARLKKGLIKIAKPKPNTKAFGLLRLKMLIYNRTQTVEKGFRLWLRNRLGEKPVYTDSTLIERSVKNMEKYLIDNGYFYNTVDFETESTNGNTTVDYAVNVEKPYTINAVYYPADDSTEQYIYQIIDDEFKRSLIKKGQIFNADKLKAEARRLNTILKNKGYYDFNSQYFTFDVDSTQKNRTLDVYLKLKKPAEGGEKHIQYRINEIMVYSNYLPKKGITGNDTLLYEQVQFIQDGNPTIKPKNVTNYLFLKEGALYNQNAHNHSIGHLLELGIYKFVNIRYQKLESDSATLNCYILLTPSKKMNVAAEAELNNRSESALVNSFFGTALTLSFNNKNLLRGGESLSFNLYSSIEFSSTNDVTPTFLNTLDLSGEFKLSIPRFLFPLIKKTSSKRYRPATNISLGVDYLRRLSLYTVSSNNFVLGYDWRTSAKRRHLFNPIAISLFSLLDASDFFNEQLSENPALDRSFEEVIIAGGNYAFIYSSQELNKQKDFYYFRGSIDAAGNAFALLENLLQANNNNYNLEIFGNDYSQYARFEGDFRHFKYLKKNRSIASRINAAIALPYGNSNVLPFIKQYYVGGANSLRAFPIRGLGPGRFLNDGTTNASEFDRTGEIKIQASVEYRYDIMGWVKGALFVDAGNVWTLKDDESRPGGRFSGRFLREFGLGTGTGVRFDFSYFVMRIDIGLPIYHPAFADGERWVVKNYGDFNNLWRNLNLNLAIGYPF